MVGFLILGDAMIKSGQYIAKRNDPSPAIADEQGGWAKRVKEVKGVNSFLTLSLFV